LVIWKQEGCDLEFGNVGKKKGCHHGVRYFGKTMGAAVKFGDAFFKVLPP
jgi:hypothetical protein